MSKIINLLLIGLGPHAQKCFYPTFEKYGEAWGFRIACVIDLESKRGDIEKYLSGKIHKPYIFFIDPTQANSKQLTKLVEKKLDEITSKYDINGVIIASEPTSHVSYAEWALKKGLN